MAALRACLIFAVLFGFFLVGAPLQWLVARRAPRFAHCLPSLFCRSLLWLCKVRVVVEGERVTARPVLLASNHVSWLDILAFGGTAPFCFLAKTDVASWPIVSAFAEVHGTVFVDRRRRRTIPQANRTMAARMLEGRSMLLFPEGTTIGKPGPGPFGSSHFAAARDLLRATEAHASVAVQPVAIAYSSDAAAWIGDDNLLSHLWRTLRAPPLRCFISFGAPIPYTADSDRKRVARLAREAIIAMLATRSAEAGLDRDIAADGDLVRAAANPTPTDR